MAEYCRADFYREFVSRMKENLEDVQRAEIRWSSRLNYQDFESVSELCKNMEFVLSGFDERKN